VGVGGGEDSGVSGGEDPEYQVVHISISNFVSRCQKFS
jgi:hypothetical protein